ncbi:MAG: hypothetical protein U0W24_06455 [Bacteroidales bacterium]
MKKINILLTLFAAMMMIFMACEPTTDTRPDTAPAPTEDQLGIEISAGADPYHWILKNTSTITGIAHWDLGNGYTADGDEVVVHYPDVATYTVKLTLVANGGKTSITTEHTQTVPDPVAGNLVKGGKFLTAEDSAQWTIQYPDLGNKPSVQMHGGWAMWDNVPGTWAQATIYQPIEVVAGQQYKVDLYFETAGAVGGWFKVYACLSQPVDGTEYTGDILVSEIGIWKDWNVDSGPVSGYFSAIHTAAGLNSNIVSFDTSGTIWLEIQCGANDLQNGVRIKNVEFRGYNP